MDLYILRHGIAEAREGGKPEAERALTPEGERKLGRVLERARAAGVSPTLILSSPYLRARQSAEAASRILGYGRGIVETDALLPGAGPEELWKEIRQRGRNQAVLVAGHEPHLSGFVSFLLGAEETIVELKKGALACVEIEKAVARPRGRLRWLLTAKLASR